MSHVTAIELEVTDLDSIEKAAEECGLKLVRDQTTFKWYGQWVNDYNSPDAAYKQGIDPKDYGKCDHALVIPGAGTSQYEIGLVKNKDGPGYKIAYDFYGTGQNLKKLIGEAGEKIKQSYVKHKTIKELAKKGFKLTKTENKDGTVKLTLKGF